MEKDHLKERVGKAAADSIQEGMVVGVGTGSTVFYFIQYLAQRCRQGLHITVLVTSQSSHQQVIEEKIPCLDATQVGRVDIVVDGADQVDSQKRMIKGGGGALFREKVVAYASQKVIIIVDETKTVDHLGNSKLPVEISPFMHLATIDHIKKQGFKGTLRLGSDQQPYLTDNHHYLYDIQLGPNRLHPEKEHAQLIHIPGVIETGYFFNVAHEVWIAQKEGGLTYLR